MVAERSAALLRASDDVWDWVQVVGWRGMARWCVGDAELAEEAREAEATAEQVGGLGAMAIIRMSRAVNALSRHGDFEAFEQFARWFIDFSVRNDFPWTLVGASWLGLTSFWRGQWDEARVLLGQADVAASLYPMVLEALDTGTVTEFQTMELLQTGAGTAASAGGQWEEAEGHYRTALRQAHELPHRTAQPEVRRWYARMLLDRKASGDADRARTLLDEAQESYEQLGMPRHVAMARDLLKSAL